MLNALPPSDIDDTVKFGTNTDGTCSNRQNCGGTSERRGGVALDKGSTCTSGPNVIKGGTTYATTAGHCWYGQTSGAVTSGSQSFGSLDSQNWLFPSTNCGCRLIPTSALTGNNYYRTDSDPYDHITGKDSYVQVGDFVLLSGQYTQDVGDVVYVEYSYTGETCNCLVDQAVLADYNETGGDSGGIVTSSNRSSARGLHSGNSGGDGRFFPVWTIESTMGVSIATS
ncbi:MAG: hypothetical protein R2697_15510 [Ilumatobacteraceae bacterium]